MKRSRIKKQIVEIQILDAPKYPESIYKYRIWNDDYQKTILTERKVFLAPPTSFEDKKDCKLFVRYDLMTNSDIYRKYLEMSKKDNPRWTKEKHKKHALKWTTNSPLKDKKHVKKIQEEHFREFDERFGVLSLTAKNSNLAMWNKYSNDGTGFCVGFDSKILFDNLGGGGEVNYYSKLPDIYYDDTFIIEHSKQVFSKEEKWSFEEEYRTHKFYEKSASVSDRQIIIPVEAYREIIFGWNTTEKDKDEIIQTCKLQGLNVEFKKGSLQNNEVIIEAI
ncbi:MAG: DUF2971 domain-containing protein [Paludibacter sp.]|nr:DUF2971 domain-containing protein [Paludibacter sp.]